MRNKKLKLLLLLVTGSLLIWSCRKEFQHQGEVINPIRAQELKVLKSGTQIQSIDYTTFLKRIDLKKLGKLEVMFANSQSARMMSLEIGETYKGFQLHLDKINLIEANGITSYIFPVKLSSRNSAIFQNLTINISGSQSNAFITTYSPTKKWINSVNSGKPIKYAGSVVHTPIDLENPTSSNLTTATLTSQLKIQGLNPIQQVYGCVTIWFYVNDPVKCGSNEHWPWDEGCSLSGSAAAGYIPILVTDRICPDGPGGMPPTGPGNTGPNTPPGYTPCGPGTESVIAGERFSRVAVIPPHGCPTEEEDPPLDPLKTKIFDYSNVRPCVGKIVDSLLKSANMTNNVAGILEKYNAMAVADGKTPIPSLSDALGAINDSPVTLNFSEAGGRWNTPNSNGGLESEYAGVTNNGTKLEFNTNFLNSATDLGIAAVALHEMMHAYFSQGQASSLPGAQQTAFATLKSVLYAETPEGVENAHHNILAEAYVDQMAEVLETFAKKIGIITPPASGTLRRYCGDIIWKTLKDKNKNLKPQNPQRINTNGGKEFNNINGTDKKTCPQQ